VWACSFDLETIPSTETLARLYGLDSCDDETAAEILGDKFASLPLHKVVVIAALLAERVDGIWHVRSLGAPHIGQRSEAGLISAFADRLADLRPTLVSYNGGSFDLPVLRYRAMIHGIAAPGLTDEYFRRYGTRHVDLCDLLANFHPRAKVGLDDLCKMMGLPGKPEGIDGSKVWEAVQQGQIQRVADYGETDVVNTYRLWLRHELFRGALTPAQLEASEADLAGYIRARLAERPHLAFLVNTQATNDSSHLSGDKTPAENGG
jgi:3'-5' exonuclease